MRFDALPMFVNIARGQVADRLPVIHQRADKRGCELAGCLGSVESHAASIISQRRAIILNSRARILRKCGRQVLRCTGTKFP